MNDRPSDDTLCEHCGNPRARHPMTFKTRSLGTLTCSGEPIPPSIAKSEQTDAVEWWNKDAEPVALFLANVRHSRSLSDEYGETVVGDRLALPLSMLERVAAALAEAQAERAADKALLDNVRVAMRCAGPHYYLVEAAAERSRKAGHGERADNLDYVYGRLFWMDHALGTMQERVDADEAARLAARPSSPPPETR